MCIIMCVYIYGPGSPDGVYIHMARGVPRGYIYIWPGGIPGGIYTYGPGGPGGVYIHMAVVAMAEDKQNNAFHDKARLIINY